MPAAKKYGRRTEARFTFQEGYVMDRVAEQLGVSTAQLLRMLVRELMPDFDGVPVRDLLPNRGKR